MAAVPIYAVLILFIIIILRTLYFRKKVQTGDSAAAKEITVPEESILKLSRAIQLKTVSYSDISMIDMEEHRKFGDFLKENFPLTDTKLERIQLNDFSYIFKWEGREKEKLPVLFMAHFDVVPVRAEGWLHQPFSGDIEDGIIWGRGTLDTKNSLVAIMESTELLLEEGFKPERTIYLAFGGDEEVSGIKGAVAAVKYFREHGIHFDWVLDEGSIIAENMFSIVKKPLALIGIAEKGFVNIRVSASGTGGHASMPPAHTASGLVAGAVAKIEAHPFPVSMSGTVSRFLKALIPHTDFPTALILSNLWIFKGIVKLIFTKTPPSAAMIRTTQAVTVMKGSSKDNILPHFAEAIINIRIIPGETVDSVLKRVQGIVKNKQVKIEFQDSGYASDPVHESDVKGRGYSAIATAVEIVYPKAMVAPFLVTAATDSRHFEPIADNIYRFSPMVLTSDDIKTVHGVNESISIKNFKNMIRFFKTMMKML